MATPRRLTAVWSTPSSTGRWSTEVNDVKAVVGGTVLTPETTIENGVVLIKDGKIVGVGRDLEIPQDACIIDAKAKYVTPGLVDGHSHIGMVTDGIEWDASDVNDFYGPVTTQMRAIDAINLYDGGFDEALSGGVTTVYTGPGSSNIFGGIGAIVKTYAERREEMVIKDFASIKMALGPKRSRETKTKSPYPTTRMGAVALARSTLRRARDYVDGRLDPESLDGDEKMVMEHLSELLRGNVPAHIHTSNMPDEILAAVRLIDEFKITATIDHGFGSEHYADLLAEKGIPVIYGPVMMTKKSAGSKYISDKTPGILSSKGVKTSIMTDAPLIPGKNLLLSAIIAAKNGMDPIKALKAVTINPAESIGIGDRVGSIEPGKDGDLVIFSGHPLKVKSVVEKVLINGEIVYRK
jgi:imidazolonepropionase-like amidohydrolase